MSGLEENGFYTKDMNQKEFINRVNGKVYQAGTGWFLKDYNSYDLTKLKIKMRYSVDD